MKKLSILLLLPFFFSCSSDNDEKEPKEAPQDYTSFVFVHNEPITLTNSVVGYYTKDGLCKKIAELGDLTQGKQSKEVRVEDNSIVDIYLFSDYPNEATKSDAIFSLRKNNRNIFEIDKYTKGIKVDKKSPTQYPQ